MVQSLELLKTGDSGVPHASVLGATDIEGAEGLEEVAEIGAQVRSRGVQVQPLQKKTDR